MLVNRLFCGLLLAGTTGFIGTIPAAAPSTTGAIEQTIQRDTLTHDGQVRTYTLHLPPAYELSGQPMPLVIALHGGGGQHFERQSGLDEKADREGFIVVYPDGQPNPGPLGIRSWNAGRCCGAVASRMNTDDVGFIRQLTDRLTRIYRIDSRRIYATGHSNGAMLCYRLACEWPDRLAAIATNSGTMQLQTPCRPARVVPILHMHAEQDRHVPYRGGFGERSLSRQWNPSVDSSLLVFVRQAKCRDESPVIQQKAGYTLHQWTSCPPDSEISYYLTADGGHAWPGGNAAGRRVADPPSRAIDANDLLWAFFSRHRLP